MSVSDRDDVKMFGFILARFYTKAPLINEKNRFTRFKKAGIFNIKNVVLNG